MADKKQQTKPPMFRCQAVRDVGTSPDGSISFVMVEELDGRVLTLAFPSQNAADFASRFMSAGDLGRAMAEKHAGKPASLPAPLATDHTVIPSGDGQTLLMTLKSGDVPMVIRLSKNRSAQLRASLEENERLLGPAAANSNE